MNGLLRARPRPVKFNTKGFTGEAELVEYLTEEIVAERKAQRLKALPTEVDGFFVQADGAEIVLAKQLNNEIIRISLNVSRMMDVWEEIGHGLQEFKVELVRGDNTLALDCLFCNHPPPPAAPSGDKTHYMENISDIFSIDLVTVYKEQRNDKVYVRGYNELNKSTIDFLMSFVKSKGLTTAFARKLAEFVICYEHAAYIQLLENIRDFLNTNEAETTMEVSEVPGSAHSRAELDGFAVHGDGSEVVLIKQLNNETLRIKFDVSRMSRGRGGAGARSSCLSAFKVELLRSGAVLSLACSDLDPAPLNTDDSYDFCAIDGVTFYRREWNDKVYGSTKDYDYSVYLYNLLMNLIKGKGVNNAFAQKLSQLASTYEHAAYMDLLENISKFITSRQHEHDDRYNIDEDMEIDVSEEIAGAVAFRAQRTELDGFLVQGDGAEVMLTKQLDNEIVRIKFNVNHTAEVDEQGAVTHQLPALHARLVRGDTTLACSFLFDIDSFLIYDVSLYQGEWNRKVYSINTAAIHRSSYNLLMDLLEDKGVSQDFVRRLAAFAAAYERAASTDLLENISKVAHPINASARF